MKNQIHVESVNASQESTQIMKHFAQTLLFSLTISLLTGEFGKLVADEGISFRPSF